MNAPEAFAICPICRDGHPGRSCTGSMPLSIVVLEIDDGTTADALRTLERVSRYAAQQVLQYHDA